MYFENFYEDIGTFDESVLTEFKQNVFAMDLTSPALTRPEYCFKDGGKLVLPMHYAQVLDREYYNLSKPLIKMIQATNHPSLANTHPFRIEISIIEPGKTVKWHHDQHLFHKFTERVHIPIITNDSVEFVSKWFTENVPYKFKMLPGHMYRFNNRVPHTVKNPDNHFRCHIMVDFIHEGVLKYFMNNDIMEKFSTNVTVTPVDEIYYLVNHQPRAVERTEFTPDDIQQLEAIKNYYLYHQTPAHERMTKFTPEQIEQFKDMKNY